MLHGTFPIMLLYRPLLSAYRQTSVASARRYLLREFADPQLQIGGLWAIAPLALSQTRIAANIKLNSSRRSS